MLNRFAIKMVSLFTAFVIAFSGFGGVVGATHEKGTTSQTPVLKNNVQESNLQNDSSKKILKAGLDEESREIFKAYSKINSYINLDEDGFYKLDKEAKNVVSEKIYERYESALSRINDSIKSEFFKVSDGKLILGEKANSDDLAIYTFGNTYWWGYAISMDDNDTRYHINNLQDFGSTAGLLTAICSAIPALQPSAIGFGLATASAGFLARKMERNNNGYGVTLNLHWLPAPYFEFTSNTSQI